MGESPTREVQTAPILNTLASKGSLEPSVSRKTNMNVNYYDHKALGHFYWSHSSMSVVMLPYNNTRSQSKAILLYCKDKRLTAHLEDYSLYKIYQINCENINKAEENIYGTNLIEYCLTH